MTSSPVRATYGAVNNSHGLISCSIDHSLIPSKLANLTDRPPGHLNPTEKWAPSIGCTAIEDWWAIWWTVPDDEAERSGMVKSEVALWHLDDIDALDDISIILCELGVTTSLEEVSENYLKQIADDFISHQSTSVVICEDLNVWATVISRFWKQLWSEAKRDFSSRAALMPPQLNDQPSNLSLLCTPVSREHQWGAPYRLIKNTSSEKASRAANFLVSGSDPTLERVLKNISPQGSDLKYLILTSRIADYIDSLESNPSFETTVHLIRILTSIDEGRFKSTSLKVYASQKLDKTISSASCKQLATLGNIDISKLLNPDQISDQVTSSIRQVLFQADREQATNLISKLEQSKALEWWQTCLSNAIPIGLNENSIEKQRRTLFWLSEDTTPIRFAQLVPQSFEPHLVDELQSTNLSDKQLWNIQKRSIDNGWSTLNACCCLQTMSLSDAIEEQLIFSGEIPPGLSFIAENAELSSLVIEVIDNRRDKLIPSIAERTVKEPDVLQYLDLSEPFSYLVWKAHIEQGGIKLPTSINRERLKCVLDFLTSKQPTYGIVSHICSELAEAAFSYTKREKLWAALNLTEKKPLLSELVKIFINQINKGVVVPSKPESELLDELLGKARTTSLGASLINAFIEWEVKFSESDLISWINNFSPEDWESAAAEIGSLAKMRHWSKLAYRIYYIRKGKPEVLPALVECRNLLFPWDQFLLSIEQPHLSVIAEISATELLTGISDLAAELYPESSALAAIWERAGGAAKDLTFNGPAKDQWFLAIKQAHNGALPNGLIAIITEIKKQFPNNSKLIQFEKVIEARFTNKGS